MFVVRPLLVTPAAPVCSNGTQGPFKDIRDFLKPDCNDGSAIISGTTGALVGNKALGFNCVTKYDLVAVFVYILAASVPGRFFCFITYLNPNFFVEMQLLMSAAGAGRGRGSGLDSLQALSLGMKGCVCACVCVAGGCCALV